MVVSISKPREKSSEFDNVVGPPFCVILLAEFLVIGLICKEQIQSENAFYSEGNYLTCLTSRFIT